MIIDRLYNEVKKKGNVCVGLDTHLDYVPKEIKKKYQDIDKILFQFNKKIIDKTMDIVPIYKLQIAYYESYGIQGLMAYKRTLEYIKANDSLSIGDIKRGDISSTAEMYGKAHFEGDFETDFITLNPYMGFDSITPYLKYLESGKKGIFVLLRTSNEGAKDIQYLKVNRLEDGAMAHKNKILHEVQNDKIECQNSVSTIGSEHLYYHVGDKLNDIASKYLGNCGYSSLGAVVGGTHIDEAKEIRERYKNMFFLIPGYGHQGGKGKDVALYLNKGNGGIVNSSRGIITAYKRYEDGAENFDKYARKTVSSMKEDIQSEIRI
ncbi:orotidine-5'-phosphate decarboxylase [Schnuerera sp.]|uniref:orotidine-5'-phosphate decarboxylase n=1 Tax=Schnuerera sp. TaxID=2794844 RepID=UPI002C9F88EF|nr:orotidine-5'-phosphate decarboxylase [Schnuerera sp.]HSH36246.1 orotidine-5'-phosphate decarboxylase [Schnuerera sp.]